MSEAQSIRNIVRRGLNKFTTENGKVIEYTRLIFFKETTWLIRISRLRDTEKFYRARLDTKDEPILFGNFEFVTTDLPHDDRERYRQLFRLVHPTISELKMLGCP